MKSFAKTIYNDQTKVKFASSLINFIMATYIEELIKPYEKSRKNTTGKD